MWLPATVSVGTWIFETTTFCALLRFHSWTLNMCHYFPSYMHGRNKYIFVDTPKKFFTSNFHRGLGKRLLSLPKRSWICIYGKVNKVTFCVLFISFVSVTAINCENHCLKYFHDSSVCPQALLHM